MNFKKYSQEVLDELKAEIDLESIKSIKEKQAEKNGTFEVIVATNDKDRHGETINIDGVDLKNFKKNPIVLFSHRWMDLPIGKATEVRKEDGKIIAKGVFASEDANPLAQKVRKMHDAGMIKTVSIGLFVEEFDRDEREIKESEMVEFSFVPIPANPEAMVIAEEKGLDINELASKGLFDFNKADFKEKLKTIDVEEKSEDDDDDPELEDKKDGEDEQETDQESESEDQEKEESEDKDGTEDHKSTEDEDSPEKEDKNVEQVALEMQKLVNEMTQLINSKSKKIQQIIRETYLEQLKTVLSEEQAEKLTKEAMEKMGETEDDDDKQTNKKDRGQNEDQNPDKNKKVDDSATDDDVEETKEYIRMRKALQNVGSLIQKTLTENGFKELED